MVNYTDSSENRQHKSHESEYTLDFMAFESLHLTLIS